MNPKISVIVPIYNGEQYLAECIDSILNQTFSDFELILVNDGSKDNSLNIITEYQRKDNRIRIINKENEGSNASRRRGVKEAVGEWIAFCDSDDSYHINAFEELFALTDNTDIVIGFLEKPTIFGEMSLEECRHDIIKSKRLPCSQCAKLFRRKIFTDDILEFPHDINFGEDMIMNIRLLFKTTKAPRILFKKIYTYRRNAISVSHTKKPSLEYEALFDKIRTSSIPTDIVKGYMHEILWSRINGLTRIAYHTPQLIANKNHPYIESVIQDAKKYGYKCNLREYILLYCRNKHIIKAVALCRLGYNCLIYRLKLSF